MALDGRTHCSARRASSCHAGYYDAADRYLEPSAAFANSDPPWSGHRDRTLASARGRTGKVPFLRPRSKSRFWRREHASRLTEQLRLDAVSSAAEPAQGALVAAI